MLMLPQNPATILNMNLSSLLTINPSFQIATHVWTINITTSCHWPSPHTRWIVEYPGDIIVLDVPPGNRPSTEFVVTALHYFNLSQSPKLHALNLVPFLMCAQFWQGVLHQGLRESSENSSYHKRHTLLFPRSTMQNFPLLAVIHKTGLVNHK